MKRQAYRQNRKNENTQPLSPETRVLSKEETIRYNSLNFILKNSQE